MYIIITIIVIIHCTLCNLSPQPFIMNHIITKVRQLDLQGGYGFSFSANWFFFFKFTSSLFFSLESRTRFFSPFDIKNTIFPPHTKFPPHSKFATELSKLFFEFFCKMFFFFFLQSVEQTIPHFLLNNLFFCRKPYSPCRSIQWSAPYHSLTLYPLPTARGGK